MASEFLVFPGATLSIVKFGDLTVMNFASSSVPHSYNALYRVGSYERTTGPAKSETSYFGQQFRWDNGDVKSLLKILTGETTRSRPSRTRSRGRESSQAMVIYYVISRVPVTQFLESAGAMLGIKVCKIAGKDISHSRHHDSDSGPQKVPRFVTQLQNAPTATDGERYEVSCDCELRALHDVSFPTTCAALFTALNSYDSTPVYRSSPVHDADQRRGHREGGQWGEGLYGDIVLKIKVSATTEQATLRYLEEAITRRPSLAWEKSQVHTSPGEITTLTQSQVRDALLHIYSSPVIVYKLYRGSLERAERGSAQSCEIIPTMESIEKNAEAIIKGINAYARSCQSLLSACRCIVKIPPMPSEEAFSFIARVETTIAPQILDQELLITRLEPYVASAAASSAAAAAASGANVTRDPLFDKLYEKVDEIVERIAKKDDKRTKKVDKHQDQITFTYGALLDAGQIFTYAECAELSSRVRPLA